MFGQLIVSIVNMPIWRSPSFLVRWWLFHSISEGKSFFPYNKTYWPKSCLTDILSFEFKHKRWIFVMHFYKCKFRACAFTQKAWHFWWKLSAWTFRISKRKGQSFNTCSSHGVHCQSLHAGTLDAACIFCCCNKWALETAGGTRGD